jgi:hypothetical protein
MDGHVDNFSLQTLQKPENYATCRTCVCHWLLTLSDQCIIFKRFQQLNLD